MNGSYLFIGLVTLLAIWVPYKWLLCVFLIGMLIFYWRYFKVKIAMLVLLLSLLLLVFPKPIEPPMSKILKVHEVHTNYVIAQAGKTKALVYTDTPLGFDDIIQVSGNYESINTIHNINEGEGNISVLSQTACLGYKQFKRIFAEYVGLNPKNFIQITRFRKTFNILQLTPQISISKVAYDCGYYDKSHLIKEFKMFTGYTPTQLLDICDTYTENLSVFNSVFINDNKKLNNIAL